MNDRFTPKALSLWNNIPAWAQEKILSNVWCTKCRAVTTMVQPRGQVKGGDLLHTGTCKRCGAKVARLIENE